MIPYELTPAAEANLREIARYTRRQWGEAQSRYYARMLASCFQKIADGEVVHRSFSALFPELLVTRCERHFIFYLHPEGQKKPEIIAVLHERMDLIARLRDRLHDYRRLYLCFLPQPENRQPARRYGPAGGRIR